MWVGTLQRKSINHYCIMIRFIRGLAGVQIRRRKKKKKKKKKLGDDDLVAELGKVSLTVFVLSDLTRLVSLRSSSANLNWGIL